MFNGSSACFSMQWRWFRDGKNSLAQIANTRLQGSVENLIKAVYFVERTCRSRETE